ncbi:MAG: prephenate dehydratase [Magnetococcales bacterium]|nr:prephenate dehydratase [Magnetococcales bacterium]
MDTLREHIDRIDDHIHDLLIERAQWVLEVGKAKKNLGTGTSFYRPEREAMIHRRLAGRHRGPFPIEALHRIYREIISASLRLERKLAVAYLGPEATTTHQAALKQFGSSCDMFPVRSIDEVFDAVEAGRVDFGVAPVENSTEGVVTYTLDRFVESPLLVCGEIFLPVVHNLLAMETDIKRVRVVYSHYRSLAQCRRWLERQLPGVATREVESTARALTLAGEKPEAAAIAGLYAADNHGLNILAENIQDDADNETRYLVIGQQAPQPSGHDKTSLMFSFRDEPGFLHRVLGIFASRGINLTRIQSRPSRRKAWDYLFFIDLEGHQQDSLAADALAELANIPGVFTKILGSYPQRAL